ncbi:hypothetical protein WJX84_004490 [Apatococcus fuscideae]|uniref:Lon proteolytic domain-containing protein n=1 Tax=Apatococcus fuscideae TaxID=2026836 RepID=A0AAW1T3X8_9CHLO
MEQGENKGSLKTTGQLGEVMTESATIAYTFARAYLQRLPEAQGRKDFFATNAVHVHFPAGATPKDGPSAGCALVTALLSLALDRAVKPDLAMTGEVSLTGRVLPIGGVKEKLLAARRSGVKTVIFPRTNERDYKELTDNVKEGVEAHFVDTYQDVFKLALGDDAPLAAAAA